MVNVALIGPGRMGVNYAKSVVQHSSAKLVAICGNTETNTKKNGEPFGVPLYFNNDWDKMFDEHPEIDTVIIATSDWAHFNPFKAALSRCKNIILEKPFATSPDEISEMLSLYDKQSSSKVFMCHTCRFDLRYNKAKQQIEEGKVGKLGYIYSRRNADKKTAERVNGKIPMAYWLTAHDIDLMRWYTNSEVKEVYAVDANKNSAGNFIIANLLFENGTRAVIEIVWYGDPVKGTDSTRMDIEGDKGKIEIKYWAPTIQLFNASGNIEFDEWDMVEINGKYIGSTPNMINYFIDALSKGTNVQPDIYDGVAAVKVCEAIHQSILSKTVIKL